MLTTCTKEGVGWKAVQSNSFDTENLISKIIFYTSWSGIFGGTDRDELLIPVVSTCREQIETMKMKTKIVMKERAVRPSVRRVASTASSYGAS